MRLIIDADNLEYTESTDIQMAGLTVEKNL